MRRFAHKRLAAIGLTAVMIIASAGLVLAYWTVTGSGSGSATAGDVSAITVNQTTTLNAMYPGDSAQTISGDFSNANSGPVYVTTVTASISSVDKANGAPSGTCDATDFTLASAVMTVDAEVAHGTHVGAWTGATLHFNDKGTNQDACKGATVHLGYSIP